MLSEADHVEIASGSKAHLLADLERARAELLTAAALVATEERTSRPVCGQWTLKDLLGHIADWEAIGAQGLGQMASEQPPKVEYIRDIDAWNEVHVRAHRSDSWEEVVAHLHLAHQALCSQLERLNEADLARSFPMPWGGEGTPYDWVSIYAKHDREHAQDIESECLGVT